MTARIATATHTGSGCCAALRGLSLQSVEQPRQRQVSSAHVLEMKQLETSESSQFTRRRANILGGALKTGVNAHVSSTELSEHERGLKLRTCRSQLKHDSTR